MRRALLLAAWTVGCLHDWDAIPVGFADAARDAVDAVAEPDAGDVVAVTDARDDADAGDVRDVVNDPVDVPGVVDVPDAFDVIDVSEAGDVTDAPDVVDATVARDAFDVIDAPDTRDVIDVTDAPDVVDVTEADTCTLRCGGVCVDALHDNAHCGSCSRGCTAPLQCNNGVCLCPAGQQLCGGVCADVSSDPNHCGSCTTVCPRISMGSAYMTCLGGGCRFVCPTGYAVLTVGASSTCAAFGGASAGVAGPTCQGNIYNAGLCSCPLGFTARLTVVQSPDHTTTPLAWCDSGALAAASEWGGAYVRDAELRGAPPAVVCRSANPLAAGCACPGGFTAIELPYLGADDIPRVLGLCNRGGATSPADRLFLGAFARYALNTVISRPGGSHCATPNPLTGDCTCPALARAVTVQSTAPGYDPGADASIANTPIDLYLCMR